MEVGDLVMVRIKDKKEKPIFVPGLIVMCIQKDKPPTFEILVNGVKHIVTHRDIGPLDLFE
jgi:hypothetical protein